MSGHYDIANAQTSGFFKIFGYYLVGFILCILLTFFAYFMAERHMLTGQALFIGLSIIAIAQFIVQIFCFMRLNTGSQDSKLDFICFLFTILVVVVVIGGTLWIMFNLNYNMVH